MLAAFLPSSLLIFHLNWIEISPRTSFGRNDIRKDVSTTLRFAQHDALG